VPKVAVIFGAGNIGRGFIGQLFYESGYEITFVDVDETLLAALRERGEYHIRLVTDESVEEVSIRIAGALHARDVDAVAHEITRAQLTATAVGARALPNVAPLVAAGIVLRMQKGIHEPLNLIVCENLRDAACIFREMVDEHIPQAYQSDLNRWIGFVDAVIGRMVPVLPPQLRERDPTLILVEPYKELPVDRNGFVGPIPNVEGMIPTDRFVAYVDRKLYIHNAGHAMLGYLGHLRGHKYGYQALDDPAIRPLVVEALHESCRGLAGRHGWALSQLRDHVGDLLRRFANRALGDTIYRLARDPIRKLGPTDRLVGAARMVLEHDVEPKALSWGIAAALCFDDARDPIAASLQEEIASRGVGAVLERISHIGSNEPLGQMVLERYRRLRGGEAWRQL